MIDEIHSLCDALRLRHTRQIVAETLQDAQKKKPSYSSFLLGLLSREHQDKRSRTIANRIKHSGLREYWTLETFPWHLQPCMGKYKRVLYELAELDFVDRGESVVFTGQSGVGKSGLASGLLMKALLAGRTGQAVAAQDLFEDLGSSLADRSTKALLKRFSRVDVLIVDEFGYVNVPTQVQINNFFRLMDSRCNRKSTIVTTNLGFQEWGKFLGNGPLTAALLSRLLQKCHVFPFPVSAVNLRDPGLKLPTSAPPPEILKNY
ncbi:MAG: ATP-binding protein [Chloroflexota bacterium]